MANDHHHGPTGQPPVDEMSLGASKTVTVAAGQHLFRQGDLASALYYVEQGCIRLERYTRMGTTMVVHTARSGDLLAEAALVADAYHCNAVALKDSRLRVYDKKDILREFNSQQRKFLFMLARQLLKARQRIELRNIRSAEERVLLFLDQSADKTGSVALSGELQELAGELGLSREALYRTLASLQKDRRIRRFPDRISIVRG